MVSPALVRAFAEVRVAASETDVLSLAVRGPVLAPRVAVSEMLPTESVAVAWPPTATQGSLNPRPTLSVDPPA
jgi:hypothetical protein